MSKERQAGNWYRHKGRIVLLSKDFQEIGSFDLEDIEAYKP